MQAQVFLILANAKDLFLYIAGFSMLIVIYFLQRHGLNLQLYFLRPLSISVLSMICYAAIIAIEFVGLERGGDQANTTE